MITIKMRDERGIVSIMITMIMMLVISLIVIGFSQVASRNERESLDRQLGTQAYYAAESGVNTAIPFVQANATTDIHTLTDGTCTTPAGLTAPTLDAASKVSVSCLMLDTQPTTLVANPVTQDSPVIFHVQDGSSPPSSFTSLVFTWTPPTNPTPSSYNCTATNTNGGITTLPVYTTTPGETPWDCAEGILRVDFVPADSFSKAGLSDAEDNTKTVYFVPNAGMASQNTVDLSLPTNAYVRKTKCATYTTSTACATTGCGTSTNATCAGIVTAGLGGNYYVRISTLYRDAGSVTVSATDATATQVGGVKFVKGQSVIDSTGKAQDQYRRIQVRVPLVSAQSSLPLFGVMSTNTICKQLSASPAIGATPAIYNNSSCAAILSATGS